MNAAQNVTAGAVDFNADAELPMGNYFIFFETPCDAVNSTNILTFEHIRHCPGNCCPRWHRGIWGLLDWTKKRLNFEYTLNVMHYGPGFNKHIVVVGPIDLVESEEMDFLDFFIEKPELKHNTQLRLFTGRADP